MANTKVVPILTLCSNEYGKTKASTITVKPSPPKTGLALSQQGRNKKLPCTWLISELEDRISSASFWAVGNTSVWCAVIKY